MKLTILFLFAVLMPIAAFSTESADTSAASNELAITQVYVDDTSIMIIGRNLLSGPWERKVKLGEFGRLTVVGTPTATLIEVELPEGISAGDYLLIVAGGKKDKHVDDYDLTIGAVGPMGPTGADGEPGAQGVQGKLGPAGAEGAMGTQGEQGKIGPAGADGETGSKGVQGKIGPTGADGAVGDRGPRGNRGWTGDDGAEGAQGVQGKIGPTGEDGVVGTQGVQGKIGPTGEDGAVGAQGVQGKIGPTGADGAVGAQGVQGKIGPTGEDGAVGAQGAQGKIGPAGDDGGVGAQGEQGKIGPAGSDGAMGAQGVQGKLGPTGSDGAVGAQGEQGKIGPQGIPGDLGLANMSCPAGHFITGFDATGDLLCASIPPLGGCSDAASFSVEMAPDLWICAYNNLTGKTWPQTYEACNETGGFYLASVAPMTRRGLPTDAQISAALTAAAGIGFDYIITGHPARACTWDSVATSYESCNGLGYISTSFDLTGAGPNWMDLTDGNDADLRTWTSANKTGAHTLASLCMNATGDSLSSIFDHRWR